MTYRIIDTKIWFDKKFRSLSLQSQHLFLYLLTNKHTHVSGLYHVPTIYISHETQQSEDDLAVAFAELATRGMVHCDSENDLVWVVKFLEYQGKGQNIRRSVTAQLKEYRTSPLSDLFWEAYEDKGFERGQATPSKGSPKGQQGVPGPSGKGPCGPLPEDPSLSLSLSLSPSPSLSHKEKRENNSQEGGVTDGPAWSDTSRQPDGLEKSALLELRQAHADRAGVPINPKGESKDLQCRMVEALREYGLADCLVAIAGHHAMCQANDRMKFALRLTFKADNHACKLDRSTFWEYVQAGKDPSKVHKPTMSRAESRPPMKAMGYKWDLDRFLGFMKGERDQDKSDIRPQVYSVAQQNRPDWAAMVEKPHG